MTDRPATLKLPMKRVNQSDQIRVMLVDDHPAFRTGLAALIENEPDLKVVAEAGNGTDALQMFQDRLPDVVLMDLRLPGMGGVETTMAIRKQFPEARVIILTTFDTDEDIYRAIQSGAKSYLLKDTPNVELAATIRAVYKGEQILPPKVANRLARRLQRADISEIEMEVLQQLMKGRSNKEMALSLFVTEDTVKARLKTLFSKLKVHDRTEAAICAIRNGIVHLE